MPTVTTRTIIETGARDILVITTPKAWVDYYKLEKGSKVEVSAYDDRLVVRQVDHTTDGPNVRHLVPLGPDMLSFPLPRSWIDSHNLKKGDKLEVVANGELTIRPVKGAEVTE